MSTQLFAVSAEVLARLEKTPDSIGELEAELSFETYLWQSIPYFLGEGEEGDEDEEDDEGEDEDDSEAHPLAAVLNGDRAIKCLRLENGAFYVISPERVGELAALLAQVKPAEVKDRVLEAELEEALDGELFEELEQLDLTEPAALAAQLLKDLKRLVKFYADAARAGLGIALYTT